MANGFLTDLNVHMIPLNKWTKVVTDLMRDNETSQNIKIDKNEKHLFNLSLPSIKYTNEENIFLKTVEVDDITNIENLLETYKNEPNMSLINKNNKNVENKMCILDLNNIKWINLVLTKCRIEDNGVFLYLHEILNDANLSLPTNKCIERNPQLEARCQKLQLQQNNYNYKLMTKSVDSIRKYHPEDTIAYQMKQINRHLIAVVQFIFSVAAGFAFGFIGVELIVGDLDFGFRLMLGIIISLIIALAEIYFLAKKLNEDLDFEESFKKKDQ